jgi:hypothetical protein
MASSAVTGGSKDPIKIQGKEYQLVSVGQDTLVAKSGVSDRPISQLMKRFLRVSFLIRTSMSLLP